jgi:hypothetical protein
MVITVPSTLFTISCTFSAYSGFDSNGPTCAYDSGTNAITLSEMFDEADEDDGDYSYVYDSDTNLSITFASLTMPDSAIEATGIQIQTYWVNDGSSTLYAVDDTTESSSVLTIKSDDFSSAVIQVSEEETYSAAEFSFEMTITNAVPNDGKIRVLIPPEIWVDSVNDIECSDTDENGDN